MGKPTVHDIVRDAGASLALESEVADGILNQSADHLAHSAARILRAHCDGVDMIASHENTRIEFVLRQNLT